MVQTRPSVVVAGANGFVGRALLSALQAEWHVIALSRGRTPGLDEAGVEWRRCDLYSLLEAEGALAGAEVAVYLVHSMLPSARLTQASFEDTDLILADNFARAAAQAGVKQIIYLGGLIPSGPELSRHLESRLEVERALGAYGVPVTALRAGMVIGAGGSSLDMLLTLVRRLPVMITPKWTRSSTQCVALDDVVGLIAFAAGNPETYGQHFDVGAPEVTSYRELMAITAQVLGKRRPMFSVPLFSPGLSKLWVSLITGQPMALVYPLIDSLQHDMVAQELTLQAMAGRPAKPLREALAEAIAQEAARPRQRRSRQKPEAERDVRSIQRLTDPGLGDAEWVTHEYLRWLPIFLHPIIRVTYEGDLVRFMVPRDICLLELTYARERSTSDRALLYITGGRLAVVGEGRGRLEFRQLPDRGVYLVAIHDFTPRLPWWLYTLTQAKAHLVVMHAFGRHLKRLGRR